MIQPDQIQSNRKNFIFATIWIGCLAIGLGALNFNNQLIPPSLYLIQYKRWGLEIIHGAPYAETYPLWGYPYLIAMAGQISLEWLDALVLIFQIVICFGMIVLWVHALGLEHKPAVLAGWSILLVPVFSFASLRGPEAWIAMGLGLELLCLRYWLLTRKWIWLVVALVTAVVAVNMRSEWLGFFLGMFLLSFVGVFLTRAQTGQRLAIFMLVVVAGSFMGIAPWVWHAYRLTGVPLFTSTNGGMTFYEGFAQGPENPWHRVDDDGVPQAYVDSIGISSMVSVEGNNALVAASLADIQAYPLAYLKKMGWVILRALTGGVYSIHDWWGEHLLTTTTKSERIQLAFAGEPIAMTWAIGSAVSWFYRIVYFALALGCIGLGARALQGKIARAEDRLVILFAAMYLLYSLAVVAIIRYNDRYISATYPLLVFAITLVTVNEFPLWRGGKKSRVLVLDGGND
jgi:hypothetical protein